MIPVLRQQLLDKQQRGLLRFSGAEHQVKQTLEQELQRLTAHWPDLTVFRFGMESSQLSREQNNDQRIKKYRALLGQECDILIFDVFAGLNPDALAALTGTIKVGGICILLTPTDQDWPSYVDPDKNKLCVEPFQVSQLSSWYERRLLDQLNQSQTWVHHVDGVYQGDYAALPIAVKESTDSFWRYGAKNQQQSEAIENVSELIDSHRAILLIADRGRGKSTALGLAVAKLFSQSQVPLNIVLISANSDSVHTVFHHAGSQLGGEHTGVSLNKNKLSYQQHSLQFVAPDQVESEQSPVSLYLVDEAASIPVHMLQPILDAGVPTVFSTTISGYEGTGRGFEHKLKPKIEKAFASVDICTLNQPIRWHSADSLEPLISNLLGLHYEVGTPFSSDLSLANAELDLLSQQTLYQQPKLLRQVFSLLVNAHYQTKPSDLRTLMDSPNIRVWVLRADGHILAAALIAEEGPIANELVEPIWKGQRRPRGHLLPQSLICHSGAREAGQYRFARVVRIAVLPMRQQQGLGTRMLAHLEQAYQAKQFDFVCTSYGASDELIRFWRKSRFAPVRLGLKKEKATGEVAIMMVKSLKSCLQTELHAWHQRFQQTLACELFVKVRSKTDSMIELVEGLELSPQLTQQDYNDLECLARYHRAVDTCWLAIWRLAESSPAHYLPITHAWVKSAGNVALVAKQFKFSGEKQVVQRIKEEIGHRLDAMQNA